MSVELNNGLFNDCTDEQRQKKNESMRQYYAKNKDQLNEYFKSYYKYHSEIIRERSKKYYWNHLEERREYARVMHLIKQKGNIKENGPDQCYKYRKRRGKQETEVKENKGTEKVDKIVVSFS